MNLSDAKRAYDHVLSECAQSLHARTVPSETAIDRASERSAKVKKRAKRAVDQHRPLGSTKPYDLRRSP
ncbi:hypothetical protein SAMN05444920_120184 [Nonomuraea solani]|uniref:Uncharacterized protein n=1 Tax=Nonomuraea solani TaxID=1144553 RepID=A0A1H6EUC7_9ACTN|nr:hypothetical protein SAMN05444920_120184 [Nonomuraea solani]